MTDAIIYLNGTYVTASEARIPVSDRGFRYGDGVFETIAIYSGRPFRLSWHLARLEQGLQALRIHATLNPATLSEAIAGLIERNHLTHGLIRIAISRGSGGRGYAPDRQCAPTLVIECFDEDHHSKKPITLWLSQLEKPSQAALPVHLKLAQGVNSTLARMEAEDHGCDEALLLNQDGFVSECSGANLFFVKAGALFTPSLACDALEGSMRAFILEQAPQHNIRCEEGRYTLSDLRSADAVFITNTARGITPVIALKPTEMSWELSPIITQLQEILVQEIEKQCAR